MAIKAEMCEFGVEEIRVFHKPAFEGSFGISSGHLVNFAVFDLEFDKDMQILWFNGSNMEHLTFNDLIHTEIYKLHSPIPDFLQLGCPGISEPISFIYLNESVNILHDSLEYPLYSNIPHIFLVDDASNFSSSVFSKPPLHTLRILFPFSGSSRISNFTHLSTPESLSECQFHYKSMHSQSHLPFMEIRPRRKGSRHISCRKRVSIPVRKTVISGFHNPSSSNCDSRDEDFNGEYSFLEVEAYQEMMTGLISKAAKVMVGGLMENVNLQVDPGANSEMTKDLNEACRNEVPDMVLEPMKEFLANMIVDDVTFQTTEYLTMSLTQELGPYITDSVVDNLMLNLEPPLASFLETSISDHIIENLPSMLERAAGIRLMTTLTRSITHSVVATMTHNLYQNGHSKEQLWACYLCFSNNAFCGECPNSEEVGYHISYYSTYYSEYFADYYADYYTNALFNADQRINGDQKQFTESTNK